MEFEKCAIMSGFRRSGHIYVTQLSNFFFNLLFTVYVVSAQAKQ